jgi:hypothetical protein
MLVGNGKVDGSGVGVDVLHAQIRAIFYLKFENENSDQEVCDTCLSFLCLDFMSGGYILRNNCLSLNLMGY